MSETVTVMRACRVHRPGAGGARQTIVMQPGPRDKAILRDRLGAEHYQRLVDDGAIDDPAAKKKTEKKTPKDE